MTAFPLLAAGFLMKVAAALFLVVAVAVILVVLIQKGKGGGLSGALGGGAVGDILGARSKEPLTWITIGMVSVFLLLAVILAKFYKPSASDFSSNQPPARQESQGTEPPSPGPADADVNASGK